VSNPLYELIAREAVQHPLTIARYMAWALQHPVHGYYRQHDPLGMLGDFITAPEVSQMFGELLGLWCVECWQQMGCPDSFALLELGPGRGTLMADALRAAQAVPEFTAAMQLFLLESNVDLRAQQAAKLAAYQPVWLETVGELPAMPTLMIANEFFDALPIRQLVRREAGWFERCIGALEGALGWVEVPADVAAARLTEAQQSLPLGAVVEWSVEAVTLMQQLAQHVVDHSGAMLVIDYGYAEPTGEPTFQAVAHHAFVDPLAAPGQADLTAQVDFTALAQAAHQAGAQVWPLQEQGAFLTMLGIQQRAAQLANRAAPVMRDALTASLYRLTADDAMGKLFKVLCVTGR